MDKLYGPSVFFNLFGDANQTVITQRGQSYRAERGNTSSEITKDRCFTGVVPGWLTYPQGAPIPALRVQLRNTSYDYPEKEKLSSESVRFFVDPASFAYALEQSAHTPTSVARVGRTERGIPNLSEKFGWTRKTAPIQFVALEDEEDFTSRLMVHRTVDEEGYAYHLSAFYMTRDISGKLKVVKVHGQISGENAVRLERTMAKLRDSQLLESDIDRDLFDNMGGRF